MNENKCPKCKALLHGRHCLECGWSRRISDEEAKRIGKLVLNKKPEPGDGAKLVEVMRRFNVTLPRNAAEWRVAYGPDGEDIVGEMPGILSGSVRLLCTDGLMAWFLLGDGETVFWGHLANLVVAKATTRSGAGARPKRVSAVDLAMEMLGL